VLPTPAITRLSLKNGRFYQVAGFAEPFPSVTTVLGIIAKPALVPWARNVALDSVRTALTQRTGGPVWLTPEWVEGVITEARSRPDQVKTEAADFGTQAHTLIEQNIQGRAPQIPPQFGSVVSSFAAWRRGVVNA